MTVFIRLMIVTVSLLAATASFADQRVVPQGKEAVYFSYAPVVRQAAAAVVNVYAQKRVADRRTGTLLDDPFFRQFFGQDNGASGGASGQRERVANSLGSGVIVDGDGLIVTNNHVIAGADDIRVVLPDRREFKAKILLADARTDLAVLRIDNAGEALPYLKMADSDALEVGDLVLAIGNPFGVGQTVTSGIVSALARTQVGVTDYQFFIQTDAAINPGNSGGALVDMKGQLVGINTAIFSRSGGSIGIGFSVPTNMVRTVVQTAASGKALKRPWLGAEFQDMTQDLATSLGFDRPEGAIITLIDPDSPLQEAGLKRGDVIIAIDDKPLENAKQLGYYVAVSQIGESRIFEIQRGDKRIEARVRMVAAPESVPRDERVMRGSNPFNGVAFANLSPAVADELDLASDLTGVVVTKAVVDAARRLFQNGDLVHSVNDTAIDSVATLAAVLKSSPSYWDIVVQRKGRKLRIQFQ